MATLIYQRGGVVLDGSYLPGVHRFSRAKRLLSAQLTCQPPTAGVLRLELEVAGMLMGWAFTVGAGQGEVRQSLALGVPVDAGAKIRWRASFDGSTEQAATDVAVTVASGSAVTTPAVTGQVVWTDGSATVPLYAFLNGGYVALTSGRATVMPDGETIWLDGALALNATGGALLARSWREGGLAARGSRLEFWLASERVGVLNSEGMWVRRLTEGTPGGEGFTFSSGGTVAAMLDATGLTATALTEN
ncbi:MAG TPA: hypothetical protein VN829_16215 [Dongiaceae bacterium]|nr:hypothetical protein [Dongiaceae bacterium]